MLRAAAPLRRRLAAKPPLPPRYDASLVATAAVSHADGRHARQRLHTLPRGRVNAVDPRRSVPPASGNLGPTTMGRAPSIRRHATKMVPRKAALALTPKARTVFQKLIAATGSEGIFLKYEISSQHALRMAFKFDLIKDAKKELSAQDEGVSLEVLEDGTTPKPPSDSWDDGLPKLYIHHAAFMKVLGGTLDVELDPESGELTPKLFDREGHEMDPNA